MEEVNYSYICILYVSAISIFCRRRPRRRPRRCRRRPHCRRHRRRPRCRPRLRRRHSCRRRPHRHCLTRHSHLIHHCGVLGLIASTSCDRNCNRT